MRESVIERARVFLEFFQKLLLFAKRKANKDWARSVPAAAVIPTVQVAATIIGSKTFVACFDSSL